MGVDLEESSAQAGSADYSELPEGTQEFLYRFETYVEQNPVVIAVVMFAFLTAITLPLLMLAVKAFRDHYAKRFVPVLPSAETDGEAEAEEQDDPYVKGSIIKCPFVWASAGVWAAFVALLTIGEALL
jgi:hypothetical protein